MIWRQTFITMKSLFIPILLGFLVSSCSYQLDDGDVKRLYSIGIVLYNLEHNTDYTEKQNN